MFPVTGPESLCEMSGKESELALDVAAQAKCPSRLQAPLLKSLGFSLAPRRLPLPERNAPVLARASPVGCNNRLFEKPFHGQGNSPSEHSGRANRARAWQVGPLSGPCMIISPQSGRPQTSPRKSKFSLQLGLSTWQSPSGSRFFHVATVGRP